MIHGPVPLVKSATEGRAVPGGVPVAFRPLAEAVAESARERGADHVGQRAGGEQQAGPGRRQPPHPGQEQHVGQLQGEHHQPEQEHGHIGQPGPADGEQAEVDHRRRVPGRTAHEPHPEPDPAGHEGRCL